MEMRSERMEMLLNQLVSGHGGNSGTAISKPGLSGATVEPSPNGYTATPYSNHLDPSHAEGHPTVLIHGEGAGLRSHVN